MEMGKQSSFVDGEDEPILRVVEEIQEGELMEEDDRRRRAGKHGGWSSMPYIIGNEMFERVASFGLTANLTVYLVREYHQRKVSAVTITQVWNGTANVVPLVGAYLADAYWGKFKTLTLGCMATFLGMVVMTLTATIPALKPPRDRGASGTHMSVLFLALALLTIGAAGVRPINLPFGMDQFDRSKDSGRKAVHSYFNWYYTTNTLAVLVGMTVMVYLQANVSWSAGYAASAVLMLVATLVFLLGRNIYIRIPPKGSIFSGIAQVLVSSFKKRSLDLPSPQEERATLHNLADDGEQLPLTQQFRFLNKAAIKLPGEFESTTGEILTPWRLCTVQRIEEVKCLIRVIPVWFSAITCMVALAQLFTYAVLQSMSMDRHVGGGHFEIPAASIAVVPLVAIVIFLPIYDRVFVPLWRKRWKEITLLQRMGIGIAISATSMVVAGIVEKRRRSREVALVDSSSSSISVFWLVPQLLLVGVSEAFNGVGQIEFYNQQFPDQMRSLGTALFSCSIAAAHYVSSIVVALVHSHTHDPNWLDDDINKGRLDYFYYLLALMGALDLLYFLIVAHFYHYKATTTDDLGEKEEGPMVAGKNRHQRQTASVA